MNTLGIQSQSTVTNKGELVLIYIAEARSSTYECTSIMLYTEIEHMITFSFFFLINVAEYHLRGDVRIQQTVVYEPNLDLNLIATKYSVKFSMSPSIYICQQ